MDARGKIFIVTGNRNTGKTRFCDRLIRAAQRAGVDVAGVISPGVFHNGEKQAIEVEDIRSGERRHLAGLTAAPGVVTATERWHFDGEALTWGDACLRESTPCELLFVDELGPLEFSRAEGWISGLRTLDHGAFRAAFVVVRPELLETALRRWPQAGVIRLTAGNRRLIAWFWALRICLGWM